MPGPHRPIIGSPSRVQKLIAAQSDPLLAKEIYEVAATLRPDILSPSLLAAYPSLHTLTLKLARSGRFYAADAVLRSMTRPSPSLFLSLFAAYSALSHPSGALSAYRLIIRRRLPFSLRLLNALLASLAPHPAALPAAVSLLSSSPVAADSLSYDLLISAAAACVGSLSTACSLFNAMLRRGLSPGVASYRSLIRGLSRRAQVSTAAGLMDDMLNRGMPPDPLACTTLLNALCRAGRSREAYKLLCRMRLRGCLPDIVHYNTLILGMCREGRALDACKVADDMLEGGCGRSPNLVTYTAIVQGLCAQGMAVEGNRYLEEMERKRLVPHFSLFHAVARGFYNLSMYEEALSVVEQMFRQGVVPHVETWVLVMPVMFNGSEEELDEILRGVVEAAKCKSVWKRKI